MKYVKYSQEEVKELLTINLVEKESVYEKLFKGFNPRKLEIVYQNMNFGLKKYEDDFAKILLDYADRIHLLLKSWKYITADIFKLSKIILEVMEKRVEVSSLKLEIENFEGQKLARVEETIERGDELENFIIGKLKPIIKKEREKLSSDLEECYKNSIFIENPEAGFHNGRMLFSLVVDNVKNCLENIKNINISTEELDFYFIGTGEIWKGVYCIMEKLKNELDGIMILKNESEIEDKKGMDIIELINEKSEEIQNEGKDLKPYEISSFLLKVMAGDSTVITKLPTLNTGLKALQGERVDLSNEVSEESIKNSKGLLGLNKENIIDIKRYVNKALTLGTEEKEVEKVLGYNKDAVISKEHPEFSPASFAKFYTPFNIHAKQWASLERDIITQGNSLKVYGESFVRYSNFILNELKNIETSQIVEETMVITEEGNKTKENLGKILDKWQEETKIYYSSTLDLLNRLQKFQDELENTLQPSAIKMSKLLNKLDLVKETKEIKQKMDELEQEIKIKQREYSRNCGLAFTGAAGLVIVPIGIITWTITGGIYGARAEKIRKEKNKLVAEYKGLEAKYNGLNSVSSNIKYATDGIEELRLAITNAITGLQTLSVVWDLMTKYIGEAKKELLGIQKKEMLLLLIMGLEAARDSWKEIPEITTELLRIFNEASKEVELKQLYKRIRTKKLKANNYIYDGNKWKDEYIKLNDVVIGHFGKDNPLQQKATDLVTDAKIIYQEVISNKLVVKATNVKNLLTSETFLKLINSEKDENIITILDKRYRGLTEEVENEISKEIRILEDNIEILDKNTRKDLSKISFYGALNAECKRFSTSIQKHSILLEENFVKPIIALKDEIKSYDESIETKLDPENILKNFKEFIPSEADISGMLESAATSQEAMAVKGIEMIYSTAIKSIDIVFDGIKLCKDIEKQSKLMDKLKELQGKYDELKQENEKMLELQNSLNELLKLEEILLFFVKNGNEELNILRKVQSDLILYKDNLGKYKEYLLVTEGYLQLRNRRLSILPFNRRELKLGNAEDSSLQVKYSQGYGEAVRAGAKLQKGVKGTIRIAIEIETLSEEYYKKVTDEIKNTITESEKSQLEETIKNKEYKKWWFKLFGIAEKKDGVTYQNKESEKITISDTVMSNAIKNNISKNYKKANISGNFEVEGQTNIPVEVFLYIEILKIKVADGVEITVPGNDVAAADKDGNTGVAKADGKLNILSL